MAGYELNYKTFQYYVDNDDTIIVIIILLS